MMTGPCRRARVALVAVCLATGLVGLDRRDIRAQAVYAKVGGGVGALQWREATAIQPALLLAAGYQAPGALTVRLDARVVGTTNSALLGPGVGVGFAGPAGPIPHAYLLGTAGTLLASEGTWTSSAGIASGMAGAGKTALFGEFRLEFLTGDMTRAQRGTVVASIVAGTRLGAARSAR
jgi:hypothetical protein